MSEINRVTPRRCRAARPITAATLTLCAGFLPMYAFWSLGNYPDTLGLFDYWSATVGDAVVLPALAASLVTANGRLVPRGNAFTMGGLILGAAIGCASQVVWLMDPGIQLNWTIPAPHTFNAAGWWHAGFVVAFSGFLGTHLGAITASVVKSRPLDIRPLLAGAACVVAFTGLVVIDNRSILDTGAARASLIAIGIGAAAATGIALFLRARSRRKR